jgi:target of rapamycin complex subunit LST8
LEISPDKKYIAAAANPAVKLYEVRSNNPNAVRHLTLSQRPCFRIIHSVFCILWMKALSFTGHGGNVTSVGFQKDGKWIFTSSEDGTVKVWDVTGAAVYQQEYKFNSGVTSAQLHPNQAEIICGFQDGTLRVIDLVANKVTRIIGPDPESSIRAVSVAANGKLIACCNASGTIYVWDLPQRNCQEMTQVAKIQAHDSCTPPSSSPVILFYFNMTITSYG